MLKIAKRQQREERLENMRVRVWCHRGLDLHLPNHFLGPTGGSLVPKQEPKHPG
jgi:hypothetical protein